MKEIKVIFIDDSIGYVNESQLDGLIVSGRIKSFLRSTGWVRIGLDPVRDVKYTGKDRRRKSSED